MRSGFKVVLFCLLTSACFGMALVQITPNGTGTASSGSLGFTATTGAVSFPAASTAGDLIVAVSWVTGYSTSGTISAPNPISINPTGQSLTFTLGTQSGEWLRADSKANGVTGIFFCGNCASIANTTTFTFTGNMSGSGGSSLGLGINVEFYLLDFSGIAMVSPKDQSGAGSGTSTVPNAGWSFTTNQTDLGITSYSGQPGANVSAGSCCTLGTNATLATVGQVQYALNLSAGTPSDAFSGATLPSWTSAWITFKGATGSSAVPRRRGYVF